MSIVTDFHAAQEVWADHFIRDFGSVGNTLPVLGMIGVADHPWVLLVEAGYLPRPEDPEVPNLRETLLRARVRVLNCTRHVASEEERHHAPLSLVRYCEARKASLEDPANGATIIIYDGPVGPVWGVREGGSILKSSDFPTHRVWGRWMEGQA